MLLINDHLQQLKIWKGGTQDNFVSFRINNNSLYPKSPQYQKNNLTIKSKKQISESETACMAETWERHEIVLPRWKFMRPIKEVRAEIQASDQLAWKLKLIRMIKMRWRQITQLAKMAKMAPALSQ